MKRIAFRPLLLGALLLALLPAAGSGATVKTLAKGLKCRIELGVGDHLRPGSVLPIILEFQNTGQPRVVKVRTAGDVVVGDVFDIPAEGRTRRCLYMPAPGWVQNRVEALVFEDAERGRVISRVDWRDLARDLQFEDYFGPGTHYAYLDPIEQRLLVACVSESGALAVNERLDADYELVSNTAALSILPDRWIGYSALDVLIVTQKAWALPEFPRGPVIDWMAMGGVCLIVDASAEDRQRVGTELADDVPFAGVPGGAGDVIMVGLGGAAFVTRQALTESHAGFFQKLGLRPDVRGREKAGHPPIKDMSRAPFWPILAFLTVFSVVVGPLGWWYLVSRKGLGLLYYVAAPAVSLLAIGLVITAALLKEGITPRVSCHAARFVDQRVKKSIELAEFGVYAPFNIGTELRGRTGELPHFMSLARGPDDYGRSLVSDLGFTVKTDEDNQVYEGVLPTRQATWFGREAIRLERRRLLAWEEGGRIVVENHLNRNLDNLVVRYEGKFARFASLSAGQKAAAEPVSEETAGRFLDQHHGSIRGMRGGCVVGKSTRLWSLWRQRFDGADGGYVARLADGIAEDVWLDSFKSEEPTSLILVLLCQLC